MARKCAPGRLSPRGRSSLHLFSLVLLRLCLLWLNPWVKLKIAWIGKTKEAAIQSLTDEYLKRLSRYAQTEGLTLKDEPALLALARGSSKAPKHTLVLLDGRGKQMSS